MRVTSDKGVEVSWLYLRSLYACGMRPGGVTAAVIEKLAQAIRFSSACGARLLALSSPPWQSVADRRLGLYASLLETILP